MSPNITAELYFLFHSFLMGILITVLYDVLRILRRIIPHNILAISLEDFLYWAVCSLLIFFVLIQENNGILRWFSVAGALAGMFLYKKTLGILFVKYTSRLVCKLLHIVGRLLNLFFRPLNLVCKHMNQRRKKSANRLKMALRRVKKKLTERKKLLKIFLTKQ